MGKYVGAEITGIDLSKPLDKTTIEALVLAHAENGVLVFPGQKISPEDLKRFGRSFGELTVHPFSTNMAEAPELIRIRQQGRQPAAPDRCLAFG